jgi:hypothetical protein
MLLPCVVRQSADRRFGFHFPVQATTTRFTDYRIGDSSAQERDSSTTITRDGERASTVAWQNSTSRFDASCIDPRLHRDQAGANSGTAVNRYRRSDGSEGEAGSNDEDGGSSHDDDDGESRHSSRDGQKYMAATPESGISPNLYLRCLLIPLASSAAGLGAIP